MVDSSDKRDYRRMTVRCQASLRNCNGEQEEEAWVENLSANGILLHTRAVLQAGDEIEVRIVPVNPLTPPLHAVAEVLRVDVDDASGQYQVGCRIRQML